MYVYVTIKKRTRSREGGHGKSWKVVRRNGKMQRQYLCMIVTKIIMKNFKNFCS